MNDTVRITSSQERRGRGRESLSLRALKWAAEQRLVMRDYAVLCALIRYMDTKYTCYPNMKALAATIGGSERTVRTAVKSLAGKGLITVAKKRTTNGHEKNHYRINIDKPPANGAAGHRQMVQEPPANGAEPPANGSAGHRQELPIKEDSIKEAKKEASEGFAGDPQKQGSEPIQNQDPQEDYPSGKVYAEVEKLLAAYYPTTKLPKSGGAHGKVLGHFNTLREHFDEETFDMLSYVIPHWFRFTVLVYAGDNKLTQPPTPVMPYLVTHREVAETAYLTMKGDPSIIPGNPAVAIPAWTEFDAKWAGVPIDNATALMAEQQEQKKLEATVGRRPPVMVVAA